MIYLRSALFNTLFYLYIVVFLIAASWSLLIPRRAAVKIMQAWSKSVLWLLKITTGIKCEFRGLQHIPPGPAIIAGKHQSLWETFALMSLVDDPVIVLKRELMFVPLLGLYNLKYRMISVHRSAGPRALKSLIAQAKQATGENRQIIIFPEGTRRPPGAEPDYKPGIDALYLQLGVPVVPFGLNSGVYWPRRRFLRYPGTIIVEFGQAIEPGMKRKAFSARLQCDIETISSRLYRAQH